MIKLSKMKGEFIMKKFHGLILTALVTCLIIPFSLAASAETNENGNNSTPTEEKTTDTTENIITEEKTEPAEPTKDTTVTPPQKSKVQTTIDITDLKKFTRMNKIVRLISKISPQH